MTTHFEQNALSRGNTGRQWLNSIPKLIEKYETEWQIEVLPPYELSYNYVAPVRTTHGKTAVLKIGFPTEKEFQTEIQALKVFDGRGVVQLLDYEATEAVMLLEQVEPGVPLSGMNDDVKATKILAEVMKRIHTPLPDQHTFISIDEWRQAIGEFLKRFSRSKSPLPYEMVAKAEDEFDDLIATSKPAVLVHGDLHHDNVLLSTRDGWLAIDPKGIAAEAAYEVAAMIRNPYEKLKTIPDLKPLLSKRLEMLSEELGEERERLRRWCLVQTVLSAVWNVEEVKGAEHAMRVAEVLEEMGR